MLLPSRSFYLRGALLSNLQLVHRETYRLMANYNTQLRCLFVVEYIKGLRQAEIPVGIMFCSFRFLHTTLLARWMLQCTSLLPSANTYGHKLE